jgi:hypothetical protein
MSTIVSRDGTSSGALASLGRGGSARQGGPGLMAMVRAWLNSPRVRRAAIPMVIVSAAVIVASVFMSSASAPSITSEVVAEQPPPLPAPSHATVKLDSEPTGAEVTRLSDGRLLGTTPLIDIRRINGQQINYRFRLAGYTDVQVPFAATMGGSFEVKATLEPKEKMREPGRATALHKASGGKGKKTEVAARAASPPTVATPMPPESPRLEPVGASPLPPLNPSVRVRRLGGR